MGWALADLAVAVYRLGDLGRARRYLYEALRISTESPRFLLPLWASPPAIALLLADQGEVERAVELYALASRFSLVQSRWFEDVFGGHIAAAAATLPPDVIAAAQERGRARDLEATVAELLVELQE